MAEALTGIGVVVVINLAMAVYSYGRLSQKVTDLCRRINSVSTTLSEDHKKLENTSERVARLESKLET